MQVVFRQVHYTFLSLKLLEKTLDSKPMITFYRYKKKHPLPNIIQSVWWLVNDDTSTQFSLISDGYTELVFPLKGQFYGIVDEENSIIKTPSIIGVSDRSIRMIADAKSVFVFVKLMPWALPLIINDSAKLLKDIAAELTNFHKIPTDYLDYYHEGRWNIEAVIEKSIFPYLIRLLQNSKTANPLISNHISRLFHDVQNLALDNNKVQIRYSKRYLEKLYQEHIGLSPMRYRRLIKIKKASLLLSTQKLDNLYSLALRLGYYDQSHFHKDFLRIVETSPSAFIKSIPQQAVLNNPNYSGQYQYS